MKAQEMEIGEGYRLLKTLELKNCRANVYVPDLSPEDEERRMERIKEVTAAFMKDVYKARLEKERKAKQEETKNGKNNCLCK